MRLASTWAVALAETRSARRQVRTWVFGVLAVGLSFVWFVDSGAVHARTGWVSPSAMVPAPRFVMSQVGMFLLVVFLFGVIFLAFDVRARDRRERMVEVLDARPVSNVELLAGRVLGVVGTALVPALVVVVLVQAFGGIGGAFGLPTEPVQTISLVTFLFVDAVPMFVAWAAVVVLLAVVLRNRLVVVVAALGLFAAWLVWSESTPLHLAHLAGPTFSANLLSDILPRFAEPATITHRVTLLVLAAGAILVAALLHPRKDDGSPFVRGATALALLVVGGAAMTGLFLHASTGVEARERWLAVHQAAAAGGGRADIEHIGGTVRIDPGDELEIDIAIRLDSVPAADRDNGELIFSLNPGMVLEHVRVNGEPATAVHRDGLLTIATSSTGGGLEVAVRARGVPDASFAYLDSAYDLATDSRAGGRNASVFLGRDASIYEREYVALMPGVHWLPNPGANVGTDDPGLVARDFYTVDLAVEVPAGWLVAGPGARQPLEDGRFRFNPRAPVPAVALFASAFERRTMDVAGVEFELLVSPKHLANVARFEDAAVPLREHIEELFEEAGRLGLHYPYRALSVVEAPATLRRCGGGWRMDTVQGLPGVMLMGERGFPTARFDFAFRYRAKFRDTERGLKEYKLSVLQQFFENDYSGGSPYLGVARNFMNFQTGVRAEGVAATALELVVEDLARTLLTGIDGFFSAHVFTPDGGPALGRLTQAVPNAFGFGSTPRTPLDAVAHRPVVWDLALGTSLADLDPGQDPARVLDVVALKGSAVARSIFDALGREQTGIFLSELRRRHLGGHYDLAAFYETARLVDADLEALLGDWLNDAALPGFLASAVETFRLPDTADGTPRFQVRVHIRNDEPVPGLLRLRYATALWMKTRGRGATYSEPVRIPGNSSVEVGVVTTSPIQEVWMAPYLSLNRRDVRLATRATVAPEAEWFNGTRPSDWRPPEEEGIVVDDLDAGFLVERDHRGSGLRLGIGGLRPEQSAHELDQGIPDYDSSRAVDNGAVIRDGEWHRAELSSSWGKYRHTVTRASAADGHARAVFAIELPHAGNWRLEYHMPFVASPTLKLRMPGDTASGRLSRTLGMGASGLHGDYEMALEFDDGERRVLDFDAAGAEVGWNDLGRFELPESAVRLVVSNRTTGEVVLADAIRWRPMAGVASNTE